MASGGEAAARGMAILEDAAGRVGRAIVLLTVEILSLSSP